MLKEKEVGKADLKAKDVGGPDDRRRYGKICGGKGGKEKVRERKELWLRRRERKDMWERVKEKGKERYVGKGKGEGKGKICGKG